MTVSRDSHDFGEVPTRQTGSTTLTVSNRGDKTLSIYDISLSNGEKIFALESALSFLLELLAGKSIDIQVSFTPPMATSYSGLLKIVSNDDQQPKI